MTLLPCRSRYLVNKSKSTVGYLKKLEYLIMNQALLRAAYFRNVSVSVSVSRSRSVSWSVSWSVSRSVSRSWSRSVSRSRSRTKTI